MRYHYTDSYLLSPVHKITVNLIGVGGTGSRVLQCLVSLNEALTAFGHPGLHVYAWDGDTISAANIGRQHFSPVDVGANKAALLVTRINRHFGYEWEAVPTHYYQGRCANITISCVDSAAARLEIAEHLAVSKKGPEPTQKPLYWLDFGNGKKTGQAVLGTVLAVRQPKTEEATTSTLPTVTKMFFKQLKSVNEKDAGPSCSLAQALGQQDLFINPSLAPLGVDLLWKLFREGRINYHGLYLNLETMSMNPIKIK